MYAVITVGAISNCLFRCRPVCLLLFLTCVLIIVSCTRYTSSFKGSISPEMESNIYLTLIMKTIVYGEMFVHNK